MVDVPKMLAKPKRKRTSKSEKSGLSMTVGRFLRKLKKNCPKKRVGTDAAINIAAVVEYLVAEVLELAGEAAKHNKMSRISPRHLKLAISNDTELYRLLSKVIIATGGVMPHIHPMLLPRDAVAFRRAKKGGEAPCPSSSQ